MKSVINAKGSNCPKCKSESSYINFISGNGGYCTRCKTSFRKRNKPEKLEGLLNFPTLNIQESYWAKRYEKKFFPEFSILVRIIFDLRTDSTKKAVFYPYRNKLGNIIQVSKIFFDKNGLLNRTVNPIHLLNNNENCLFNEYLLFNYRNNTQKSPVVILLESEEQAVIGSILYPKYIWLATGLKQPLSYENAIKIKDSGFYISISFQENPASKDREIEAIEMLSDLDAKVLPHDLLVNKKSS